MPDSRIEALDHTGDVGFVLRAPSLEALFELACRALLAELLTDPPAAGAGTLRLTLNAPDRERLLLRWLDELLYLVQTRALVPTACRLTLRPPNEERDDWQLRARLRTAPLDPERQGWRGELKGATYHALRLAPTGGGWHARVVLDA